MGADDQPLPGDCLGSLVFIACWVVQNRACIALTVNLVLVPNRRIERSKPALQTGRQIVAMTQQSATLRTASPLARWAPIPLRLIVGFGSSCSTDSPSLTSGQTTLLRFFRLRAHPVPHVYGMDLNPMGSSESASPNSLLHPGSVKIEVLCRSRSKSAPSVPKSSN